MKNKGLLTSRMALIRFKGSTLGIKGCSGAFWWTTASCGLLLAGLGWLQLAAAWLKVGYYC